MPPKPAPLLSHLPVYHVLTAWQSLSPHRQPDGHEDTGAQDRTRDGRRRHRDALFILKITPKYTIVNNTFIHFLRPKP